eukprot:11711344-Prorocentrum_lima.AAC.1
MTSSLVGSEMCIRDRKRCVVNFHNASGCYAPAKYACPDLSRDGTNQFDCLLYTSDAADDM